MYKYLGWHEWVLWLVEALLTSTIIIVTKVPTQRILMSYMLVTTAIKFALVWGPAGTFAQAYYWFQIPEDILVAAAAIGTCSYAFPRYKTLLTWFGPVTMAIPTFFILLLERKVSNLEPAELLATIAMGGSFVMVAGCLILEENNKTCWSFLAFLTCLLSGTQLHLRFNYSVLGRLGPEIGFVAGLMCLCGTWVLRGVVTDRSWPSAETYTC